MAPSIPSEEEDSSAPHPMHHIYPPFFPSRISDSFIHAFSGATAGFASGVIVCPLDVIKTKLQAQGGFSILRPRRPAGHGGTRVTVGGAMGERVLAYRGLVGTAKTIWGEEGVRGMYRGLGPLILGYLPTWTVYFTVYEKTKGVLDGRIERTWVTHIVSSMTAGACSTLCTNPIWVIKTRLMSQTAAANSSSHHSPISNTSSAFVRVPYHYTSTLDAARKMYLHEGIWSFYSGLAPALLGLTHVAVQFPLYEQFKKLFTGIELGKQSESGRTDFWGILGASCLSKLCASSATYPHEVLRTRMQTQKVDKGGESELFPRYRGIIHSAKTVYREEGWRAFYAGMGTNMIRAIPASAMTLLTYELMVGKLNRWKAESEKLARLSTSRR